MSVTHEKPDDDDPVYMLMAQVIQDQYPVLARLNPELKIGVLFVKSDNPEKRPALKHRGHAAAALISVVSQKERADGGSDVLLQIDGDTWPDKSPRRQEALISHELRHIELPGVMRGPDDTYAPAIDALERPIVKMRRHDWELGGFDATVERYGNDAIEKQYLDSVVRRVNAPKLPFAEDADSDQESVTLSVNGSKEMMFKGDDFTKIGAAANKLRQQAG